LIVIRRRSESAEDLGPDLTGGDTAASLLQRGTEANCCAGGI